jgi:2-polyprenyl-3-methyl-5-hydroxy-6-metoxy-1,4-benzoquinol methylase
MSTVLNQAQALFVHWNAERLDITTQESLERFQRSYNSVNGHHSGEFKAFSEQVHEYFVPFFNDDIDSTFDMYAFHGYFHFLRMIAAPDPQISGDDPVVKHLLSRDAPLHIFDFGCGAARLSMAYAQKMQELGKEITLHLADIPTIRHGWLEYVAKWNEVDMKFYECTKENPLPDFPEQWCDFGIAIEVFEHVHDPILYFKHLDGSLTNDGMLLTNINNHKDIFTHVSPDLSRLREAFETFGYFKIGENASSQLFKKGL